VVDKLVAFQVPQIVYVACDPAAFARDATRFVRAGYRLVHAVPIDAFPMTHHVETVALLVHGDRLS
jgi:tRNA/tmRNA/rRNA uracil-C5-methylase (TrmA/RlmC/RlmD family)